jgi:hypothetical protein
MTRSAGVTDNSKGGMLAMAQVTTPSRYADLYIERGEQTEDELDAFVSVTQSPRGNSRDRVILRALLGQRR